MNGGGADTNVNGQRAWDAFWKVLSILVLPWCTFMSWAAWQTASDVRVVKVKQEDFERRLDIIEVQMGHYLEEDDIVRYDDDFGRE